MSFIAGKKTVFTDIMQFMSSSLEHLVKNLPKFKSKVGPRITEDFCNIKLFH